MRKFNLRSLLDAFIFLSAASGLNWLWFSHNPAYREWAWHPYLLVIVLIGLFYGLWESIGTLIVCNLFYTAQLAAAGLPLDALWTGQDGRNLLSFLLASLFFGEAGELYRRHILHYKGQEELALEKMSETLKANDELRDSNLALQECVKFIDSDLTHIHSVAQKLFSLQSRNIYDAGLELMAKITGATAGSFYLYDRENSNFLRYSVQGTLQSGNPLMLSSAAAPFRQMMENPAVVSVRDLPSNGDSKVQWVAAAPLTQNGTLHGVFLMEAMPFLRLNAQALDRMKILADIAARCLDNALLYDSAQRERPASYGESVPAESFQRTLERELSLMRRKKSPGSLLTMEIENLDVYEKTRGEGFKRFVLDRLIRMLETIKRKEDTLCYQGENRFSLLMPQTTPDQVESFIHRTKEHTASLLAEENPAADPRISFSVHGLDSDAVLGKKAGKEAEKSKGDSGQTPSNS